MKKRHTTSSLISENRNTIYLDGMFVIATRTDPFFGEVWIWDSIKRLKELGCIKKIKGEK